MNIVQAFKDPRHQRSEELAFFAERADSNGDLAGALAQYAKAAVLEEEIARAIPGDVPTVRELFAISAVALWLRAERWDEAARAGCAFLAEPAKMTAEGVRAVRKLVDRAWRTGEMQEALGPGAILVPLEATLSGGMVRDGLAPSTVVAERREVLAPLLIRVAEWRSHKKYRRTGASTLSSAYDILEAPAVAGSYGLRLYVGATLQQVADGAAASPRDVVEQFLGLAEAVATGPDALRAIVGDDAYLTAFLRGFRDLAPDGKAVGRVDLGAMIRGKVTLAAMLTVETRQTLTTALRRRSEEKSVSMEGILTSINLRGADPKIGVTTAEAVRIFRIARGEHDDTIGPKLNRSVRIQGRSRVSEFGDPENWADDIALLEDTADERPS